MTKLPDTVTRYSEYAAQEFVQTAVFVDDRIYERKDGSVSGPKQVTPPKLRKKVTKTATSASEDAIEVEIDDEEEEYSPHDVVTSFAKKQIICSLYQPNKSAKVTQGSDIFPLCRAADIVIVDWGLYGDKGERALELIDGLIKQAIHDVPEQLRLILVYTQEVNLFNVANELYEKVSASIGDALEPLENDDGLAFRTVNSRVSVLGKPGRERPGVGADHIVEERELANVAVKEFAKIANGLLHAATLLGLAEIKKNSRKVLSKFNGALDPAFLTHLAMCLPEEDATSHIIPLLVSEIEAVLEDVLPRPLVSEALLRDWCQNVWHPGDHLAELLGQNDLDTRTIAEAICLKGFVEAREQFNQVPKLSKDNNKTRSAAKILLPAADDNGNHRFSRLMASRTFYGAAMPKTLKLGSIVYCTRDDTYLLCIQPICDSVRLKEDTVFVFVELAVVASDSGKPISHIVTKDDGSFVELYFHPKSYNCRAATFVPNLNEKKVRSRLARDKKIVFNDKSRRRYEWIDQLKMAHAQRAVGRLASDLSRVGLTESEWLRRLDKK